MRTAEDAKVGDLAETFLEPRDARSRSFAHVPAAAASDVACSCGLDGHIATRRGYVPVKIRSEKLEASELSRYMRPQLIVNAITSEARCWLTRTLTWLLLRALLLKERATVVDTVPMPTLSPSRSPIRARVEMCLFILGADSRGNGWGTESKAHVHTHATRKYIHNERPEHVASPTET